MFDCIIVCSFPPVLPKIIMQLNLDDDDFLTDEDYDPENDLDQGDFDSDDDYIDNGSEFDESR